MHETTQSLVSPREREEHKQTFRGLVRALELKAQNPIQIPQMRDPNLIFAIRVNHQPSTDEATIQAFLKENNRYLKSPLMTTQTYLLVCNQSLPTNEVGLTTSTDALLPFRKNVKPYDSVILDKIYEHLSKTHFAIWPKVTKHYKKRQQELFQVS